MFALQTFRYEAKFIKKIVQVIEDKLSRTPLNVELKLIGVQSQVKHINLWLQDGSSVVGILVAIAQQEELLIMGDRSVWRVSFLLFSIFKVCLE